MSRRLILPIALATLVLALFLALGTWQLQRLAWKQSVLTQIVSRIGAAPVALPAAPDPEADRFLPVVVSGQMTDDELHLLVSRRDWGVGFRIIAGFVTDDGRRIMVDRGFVIEGDKDTPRDLGSMRIEGNLHWPDERDKYTPANDPGHNFWYAREVEVMARALEAEPVLIIARSQTDVIIDPMPVTSEGIPNDHLEYAITWFLLAGTWVVMTGAALWRIKRRTQ